MQQRFVLTRNEDELFANDADWRLDENTKAAGRAGIQAARRILEGFTHVEAA